MHDIIVFGSFIDINKRAM